MALRDYAKFFMTGESEKDENTPDVLAWVSQPYHARFLAWLETEASRPIKIANDQLTVLESAVRANTLREVRQHIVRISERARAALEEAQNG